MPTERKRKAEHFRGGAQHGGLPLCDDTEQDGQRITQGFAVHRMFGEARAAQCDALRGITKIVDEHMQSAAERTQEDTTSQRDKILSIESIVSNISFAKLLAQIEPSTASTSIPIVSRKYEENFMRECVQSGERPCIMGAACEGMFLDRSQPFVCVRFTLPNIENGTQNMCILCLRKTTQVLFYKTVFHGIDVRCLIQKHGNIANKEGEYGVESMLVCHPNGPVHCMPLPIVAHQRNRYRVVDIGGKKYAKQHGVDPCPF